MSNMGLSDKILLFKHGKKNIHWNKYGLKSDYDRKENFIKD